jgi:hypothetical protein
MYDFKNAVLLLSEMIICLLLSYSESFLNLLLVGTYWLHFLQVQWNHMIYFFYMINSHLIFLHCEGSRELGGDPLESFGGIHNIPRNDNTTYPSELVFSGQYISFHVLISLISCWYKKFFELMQLYCCVGLKSWMDSCQTKWKQLGINSMEFKLCELGFNWRMGRSCRFSLSGTTATTTI